jgi:hypothetical protein
VNERFDGAALSVGSVADVTVRVMGIVLGLFEAPLEVRVTLPV